MDYTFGHAAFDASVRLDHHLCPLHRLTVVLNTLSDIRFCGSIGDNYDVWVSIVQM